MAAETLPAWAARVECLTVTCTKCRSGFEDYDNGATLHFSTTAEAIEAMERAEWRITADGALCFDCAEATPKSGDLGGGSS